MYEIVNRPTQLGASLKPKLRRRIAEIKASVPTSKRRGSQLFEVIRSTRTWWLRGARCLPKSVHGDENSDWQCGKRGRKRMLGGNGCSSKEEGGGGVGGGGVGGGFGG